MTKEGLVVVPDKARKALEHEIEKLANMLSVSNLSSKKITSPLPCVAFEFENQGEHDWLKRHQGILYKNRNQKGLKPIGTSVPIDLTSYIDDISDRHDGIALMAEAMNHEHLGGKLHEYFRLFERAFRLGADRIAKPMADYFANLRYGYSVGEIESWMKVRHSIAHGKANRINVTESHVAKIFGRVEQAAFDILMNKELWFNPNSSRKKVWHPDTGTDGVGMFVTRNSETRTVLSVLDEFEVFVINFECTSIPEKQNMWHKYSDDNNPKDGLKIDYGRITFIEDFYDLL